MNIEFQYPEAFWLLLFIPFFILLYTFYFLWKKRVSKRIGDEKLVGRLIQSHSSKKELLKFSLIVIGFALGCIAVANPRQPDRSSVEQRTGIDVIIALDVSNSMMATDIVPNRLKNAQELLQYLVTKMPDDRIGLILFAGHAYLQMPLSTDHDAANLFISTASPDAIPEQGTSIGEALEKADLAFDETNRFKTIILITDGETHDEDALQTAKRLAKKGIMINTVGIGSTQGATIIDTATHSVRKDEAGNVVISRLNEPLLQQLAVTTNGTYIHFQNAGVAVSILLQQYKDVDKKALADISSMNYTSFYWWMVLPMLLFLVIEIFIPDRRKIRE